MQSQRRWIRCRSGNSNPVIMMLLAGILLAIVVLIVVMIVGHQGVTETRDESKPTHKPIGDPDRIKETLKAGKMYRAELKSGFTCRVEDKDWGVSKVINMIYEMEMVVNRKVESNDGHRVVELRQFETCRNVKLLTTVDDITFDFGVLGNLSLVALEKNVPGSTTIIEALQPLVVGMIRADAQRVLQDASTKAWAHIDTLLGKTVRIVYSDETGVESVQPVDCTLTPQEQGFLDATAVVSDCHIMDLKIAPGGTWTIDAGQLGGLIDPSLRGIPAGQIRIQREKDTNVDDVPTAHLRVASGIVTINSSDLKRNRLGRFVPQGTLAYNLRENYVNAGQLRGDLSLEEVSTDHILFKAEMKTQPTLVVIYSCRMQ